MNKNLLAGIIANSIIFFSSISATVYADTSASVDNVKIQRSFVNLDFQDVIFPLSNQQVNQNSVPGWRTTHRDMGGTKGRIIEIWKGAGHSSGNLPNAANDQYAELNAEENSALYQKVCLFGGETFNWSLQHAARQTNTTETMEFLIGTVADGVSGSQTYSYTELQKITTSSVTRNQTPRWATRTGTTTVSSIVPESGGIYSFIFKAQNGSTLGNFLDNIVLKLKPAVEFDAASGNFYEGDDGVVGSEKPIAFNIVGHIIHQDEMPTLQFEIKYPEGYAKTKAVYAKNYKLYKKIGSQLIELNVEDDALDTSDPNHITFNYTPIYDPNLDYTTGVRVEGLVIKIIGNTNPNADINLPISFALDEKTGEAKVTSLKSCGGVKPQVNFDVVIKEDDIDVAVIKKLTPESMPVKDNMVSYTLDINNNSNAGAENIFLRDTLSAGLQRTADTELICEDLTTGTSQSCPTTWATGKAALDALFTDETGKGMSLGTLPAHAKYRIKLNNLKVIDPQNRGLIKNIATIETTTMTDIDPTNNESVVESLIFGQSDLSNHVAGTVDDTGIGLFYIAEGGRTGTTALLSQSADQNGQVYFPLLIENKSPYAQDYKLHASSTAIATLNSTLYSGLDQSTISSYTSGLDIKFYLAEKGQCKAGLTANGLSQIKIDANTSAQVCAQVMTSNSAQSKNPIWFAVESVQTGLADIIKNEVIYNPLGFRQLELVNDQRAQVAVGGSYVFLHRLFNKGTQDEKDVTFDITSFNNNDGFAYTLFFDKNNDGQLDAQDQIIHSLDQKFSVAKDQLVQLLLKVQAPSTATNGMMSQVRLTAIPNNTNQSIMLESLVNTDTVYVGSDQVEVTKMQFVQSNCSTTTLSVKQIQDAEYSLARQTIGENDCVIYRITVKNTGSEKLSKVKVNDMYPAYTVPWKVNLPLVALSDSRDVLTDDGNKIEAILYELLPQEEKSLYFGIKVRF